MSQNESADKFWIDVFIISFQVVSIIVTHLGVRDVVGYSGLVNLIVSIVIPIGISGTLMFMFQHMYVRDFFNHSIEKKFKELTVRAFLSIAILFFIFVSSGFGFVFTITAFDGENYIRKEIGNINKILHDDIQVLKGVASAAETLEREERGGNVTYRLTNDKKYGNEVRKLYADARDFAKAYRFNETLVQLSKIKEIISLASVSLQGGGACDRNRICGAYQDILASANERLAILEKRASEISGIYNDSVIDNIEKINRVRAIAYSVYPRPEYLEDINNLYVFSKMVYPDGFDVWDILLSIASHPWQFILATIGDIAGVCLLLVRSARFPEDNTISFMFKKIRSMIIKDDLNSSIEGIQVQKRPAKTKLETKANPTFLALYKTTK